MSKDFDVIKAGLAKAVPFNTTLGLEVTELGEGTATVLLPDDERLRNHIGSQHAGGLFAAAEAASGAAFLGAFVEHMAGMRPLVTNVEIAYKRIARGAIEARAQFTDSVERILKDLDAEGKAKFDVAVSLVDGEGTECASATARWDVRKG